jgi:hypothetical protein
MAMKRKKRKQKRRPGYLRKVKGSRGNGNEGKSAKGGGKNGLTTVPAELHIARQPRWPLRTASSAAAC